MFLLCENNLSKVVGSKFAFSLNINTAVCNTLISLIFRRMQVVEQRIRVRQVVGTSTNTKCPFL